MASLWWPKRCVSLLGVVLEQRRKFAHLLTIRARKVSVGAGLVEKAGAAIIEVAEAARSVTHIMHDIPAASAEQSSGITEVNQAVAEMDQATQQNALRVQETARAAVALRSQDCCRFPLKRFDLTKAR